MLSEHRLLLILDDMRRFTIQDILALLFPSESWMAFCYSLRRHG
jgi:hypothetical protein